MRIVRFLTTQNSSHEYGLHVHRSIITAIKTVKQILRRLVLFCVGPVADLRTGGMGRPGKNVYFPAS